MQRTTSEAVGSARPGPLGRLGVHRSIKFGQGRTQAATRLVAKCSSRARSRWRQARARLLRSATPSGSLGRGGQSRSQNATVGLREEHGHTPAERRELVSVRCRGPGDELLPLETAQVVGGVPTRVGRAQQGTGAVNEITVGEAPGDVAEPNQGREHSRDPRVPEAKSWSRDRRQFWSVGSPGGRWPRLGRASRLRPRRHTRAGWRPRQLP
jgi:hypothetical protein